MFVSGMNPFWVQYLLLLIAIPSAVKAFNFITTLWKGNLQFNPAMLFAIGLVSTFITGGLTGIILGDSTLDINVHDTYFVAFSFGYGYICVVRYVCRNIPLVSTYVWKNAK
jgi:cytochrome c oxidase subunit 1